MLASAVPPPTRAPTAAEAGAPLRRVAQEFEAVLLGQLLGAWTQGLGGAASVGGAAFGGDDPFAAMLRDEYAKLLGRGGRVGIADAVVRQLLRAQEAG